MDVVEDLTDRMVPIATACAALGVSRATLYRQTQPPRPRSVTLKVRSPRRLRDDERQAIIDVLHSSRSSLISHPTRSTRRCSPGASTSRPFVRCTAFSPSSERAPSGAPCGARRFTRSRRLRRRRPTPGVDLGYHQASRPDEGRLLLPVRRPRPVQSHDRGLAPRRAREREPRTTALRRGRGHSGRRRRRAHSPR